MTQKISFAKETIVEAAFALTRERGWGAVTARSIAKRLGSSTMPIYSSMKSMEEIEREVREKAEKLMLDYQQRSYSDNNAVNMAVGYVTFAKDERNLFRFLFDDRPKAMVKTVTERDPRILKSWIFTHGLASMISSGVLDLKDERIMSLLVEAGGAFAMYEAFMQGKEKENG